MVLSCDEREVDEHKPPLDTYEYIRPPTDRATADTMVSDRDVWAARPADWCSAVVALVLEPFGGFSVCRLPAFPVAPPREPVHMR